MSKVAIKTDNGFPPEYGDSALPRSRKISGAGEIFPLHALVVDDEPLIRWSVGESLAGLGVDVEYATDAATALKIVTTATLPFDIVLLDLRLPDMHDLSLLSTLRQVLPTARLVLMTAFGTPEILDRARALGAAVLDKPFEMSELNDIVIELMAGRN